LTLATCGFCYKTKFVKGICVCYGCPIMPNGMFMPLLYLYKKARTIISMPESTCNRPLRSLFLTLPPPFWPQ
jgi:hypothetical protein